MDFCKGARALGGVVHWHYYRWKQVSSLWKVHLVPILHPKPFLVDTRSVTGIFPPAYIFHRVIDTVWTMYIYNIPYVNSSKANLTWFLDTTVKSTRSGARWSPKSRDSQWSNICVCLQSTASGRWDCWLLIWILHTHRWHLWDICSLAQTCLFQFRPKLRWECYFSDGYNCEWVCMHF